MKYVEAGGGVDYLSPPGSARLSSASTSASVSLGFFGSIVEDQYAQEFPDAIAAAVMWTYVPIRGIGSYSAVPHERSRVEKLRAVSPECRLMLAILEDVQMIIHDGRHRYKKRIKFPKRSLLTSETIFYEAVRWVLSLDKVEEDQLSFEQVCGFLGFDPDATREALLHKPLDNRGTEIIESGRTKRLRHRATQSQNSNSGGKQ